MAADLGLLVDGCDALVANADVGQLEQRALLGNGLGDLCRLGRLDDGGDEVADRVDLCELGVVDAVARQLEDALVDL
ncbi:hypothetical protein COL5a_006519 [Colletotrichum fioriniae]|nr:hypothetical protein COL5a_006519 [Colletotrichum fioriniae]